MKTCTKCKERKPVSAFQRDASRGDGLQCRCRACANAYKRQWAADHSERAAAATKRWAHENPERVAAIQRRSQLKRNYGITSDQFDAMVVSQGNRCAICGTDEPGGQFNQWHVDHDHDTGAVRGLLCNNCNRGIGYLKDDIFVLESAIVYLQRGRSD